jgi:hypothetical protein
VQETHVPLPLQYPAPITLGSVQGVLVAVGVVMHFPVAASQEGRLQNRSTVIGKLHWLLWMQATQEPLPLQTPAVVPSAIVQAMLTSAGAVMQLLVAASHTMLLQVLCTPSGKLHCLLWVQATQRPLPWQNPGCDDPAKEHARFKSACTV